MKKFLLILLLVGCSSPPEDVPELYYWDLDVRILDMGGNSPTPSKYSHDGKYFYVRSVSDTSLRAEFTRDNFFNLMWRDSVYYNHKVGDTLHFKYILKRRFFQVKK